MFPSLLSVLGGLSSTYKWDKMAEIMQIISQYCDQIRLYQIIKNIKFSLSSCKYFIHAELNISSGIYDFREFDVFHNIIHRQKYLVPANIA